jgi:heme-degrading monooxygenase HmoA
MRKFADLLARQSGFIDGSLLKATFEDTPFEYIEVTRWDSQRHWEELFDNPEFVKLMDQNNTFHVKAADLFTPVHL